MIILFFGIKTLYLFDWLWMDLFIGSFVGLDFMYNLRI